MNLHPKTANGGLLGIVCGALLLASGVLVAAPGAETAASEVSTYYVDHRISVVLATAVSLVAAVVFLAFALRFAAAVTPGPDDMQKWRLVWSAAVLVFAGVVVAALPVVALALTSEANAARSYTGTLAQLSDGTDAALFVTVAIFLAATATQGIKAPAWLRAGAAIGALFAIARALTSLFRVESVLDPIAPLAFVTVILAASIWMLLPGPPQADEQHRHRRRNGHGP